MVGILIKHVSQMFAIKSKTLSWIKGEVQQKLTTRMRRSYKDKSIDISYSVIFAFVHKND